MKLATYKDGSKDGQLIVVSKDLSIAHYTTGIVHSFQQALEDWNFMGPQLQDLYEQLNAGKTKYHFPFQASMCKAPLSRSYQHLWSPAYLKAQDVTSASDTAENQEAQQVSGNSNNLLTRKNSPDLVFHIPSDFLMGPQETLYCPTQQYDIDIYPQISVVLGDVVSGCDTEQALESIRFLMLSQQVVYEQLQQQESEASTPLMQSRGPSYFSPVAVSLDELSEYWNKGKGHFQLQMHRNGKRVGCFDTAADMLFHFGEMIAFAARNRPLSAGTLFSVGPVAQLPEIIKKQNDLSNCFSSVAQKRAIEKSQNQTRLTDFYQFNDEVKLDIKDKQGQSIFGALQLNIRDTHEVINTAVLDA